MALARLVREEAGGMGLFALYHPTPDNKHVELSSTFIHARIDSLSSQGLLVSDPTSGQVWRNEAVTAMEARDAFTAPHEFAITSRVNGIKPLPGDMVYVKCAIAEVMLAENSDGKLVVKLASEQLQVLNRTLYQTCYRFLHDAKTIEVTADSVIFPLDLLV